MSHSDKNEGIAQSACFRRYYYLKPTPKNILWYMEKSTFSHRTENLTVTLPLEYTLTF